MDRGKLLQAGPLPLAFVSKPTDLAAPSSRSGSGGRLIKDPQQGSGRKDRTKLRLCSPRPLFLKFVVATLMVCKSCFLFLWHIPQM